MLMTEYKRQVRHLFSTNFCLYEPENWMHPSVLNWAQGQIKDSQCGYLDMAEFNKTL